jgi:hypothetical protein
MKNILVYAQDLGGAQNVALVARELAKEIEADMTIIVHPLAKTVFDEFRLPFQLITQQGFNLPLGEKQARQFLDSGGFTHIFCGTSNQHYDPSNSNIIQGARQQGIRCFGLLEHWKGWDRFYNERGALAYVPDILGCIDAFSAAELEQMGVSRERLAIVGHPYLEWVYKQMEAGVFYNQDRRRKVIGLISQPLVSRNFESMLNTPIESTSLIERIAKIFGELQSDFDFAVFYRPHPKERRLAAIPDGVILNEQQRWIDVLKDVDVVVGLDSMALIEAFFAGKKCISLKLPELEGISDMNCPFQFSVPVRSLEQFALVVASALRGDAGAFPRLEDQRGLVVSSIKRCTKALHAFFNTKW